MKIMKQKIATVRQLPDGIMVTERYVDMGPRIIRSPLTGRRIRRPNHSYPSLMTEMVTGSDQSALEQKIKRLLDRQDGISC